MFDVYLCFPLQVDFPGFSDTRGTEYEMCTLISIDQAMAAMKKVKAVAIVISFSEIADL